MKKISLTVILMHLLCGLVYGIEAPEDGVHEEYYDSGAIHYEINYKNDMKNGIVKEYYKNGNLRGEANYKNNIIVGIVKYYYENGNLLEEKRYKDGKLLKVKEYDENGKPIPQYKLNGDWAYVTIRTLSAGAETFVIANDGKYPMTIDDLVDAIPPYIDRSYCGEEFLGYNYSCTFNDKGYFFTATPIELGVTGTRTYTVKTGGIFDH